MQSWKSRREQKNISVLCGVFLPAICRCIETSDTIVFDKTGTLTKAKPML